MTRRTRYIFLAYTLFMCSAACAADKPNILVFLCDDTGYAEFGFQGGKDIPTPHIDSIAANGVRFTQGYVSGPYCSPTARRFVNRPLPDTFWPRVQQHSSANGPTAR